VSQRSAQLLVHPDRNDSGSRILLSSKYLQLGICSQLARMAFSFAKESEEGCPGDPRVQSGWKYSGELKQCFGGQVVGDQNIYQLCPKGRLNRLQLAGAARNSNNSLNFLYLVKRESDDPVVYL
jgi:hypothetical protein